MRLTDEQKEHARDLGLTEGEYRFALATHVAPERFAVAKAELAAEDAARVVRAQEVNEAMLGRAAHWPTGRGQRPDLGEPTS